LLSGGIYTGTVTVSDPAASNSPQTVSVSVTLNVTPTSLTQGLVALVVSG
jgi:hypothetical protein